MFKSKDWILWVVAIVLFLAALGYTIYSIGFLARELDVVLSDDKNKEPLITRFDFDKLNQVLSGKSLK